MLGRVVLLFVDAKDDCDVLSLGRRRDDHLFRTRCDVLLSAVSVGEEPGGLEHDVNAQVFPRQLRRVAHRQHFELVAIDRDRVPFGLDFCVQVAEHRVVLQQMRQRRRVRQVVDRDEVDVFVGERRPHDVPADAAEPVDANLDRHPMSSKTCADNSIGLKQR